MTKEEATALFERIWEQLSNIIQPCRISLVYLQEPGLSGLRTWYVEIKEQNTPMPWIISNEQDWQHYKQVHAVLETAEELEDYAEASRNVALSELEEQEGQ